MGFKETFQKFRSGLTKTRDSIVSRVNQLVLAKSKIDDDVLDELEEILISGDVGVEATTIIVENIKKRVKEEKYASTDQLTILLRDEIAKVLRVNGAAEGAAIRLADGPRPFVILVVGVNGVGKTTTIGKLAHQYRTAGYSVLIGAADTFRAAANEQLEIWARRAGVEIIQQARGADPAAVAYDTLSSALSKRADVVIIDTAGRLHTKVNLMEELKKIKKVLQKRQEGAPHEVLLVLDAGTGQNGLQQARQFSESVGVTGLVLTKLDGTAKGGIVLAISNTLKIPVRFIGVGEQLDDLQPFDGRAFVDALFDKEASTN